MRDVTIQGDIVKRSTRSQRRLLNCAAAPAAGRALAALLLGWRIGAGVAAPSLEITHLPPYGSFDPLRGVVREAGPNDHRVAVFIYVPGAGWWSKPSCAQPLTPIQADGTWTADITTGGSDQLATRIAALLVGANYTQPCVQGLADLPTNVFAPAVASAVVTRPQPGVRWLAFAGYDWWVKSSAGRVGPGPNYFSASTNNVWLDAQGRLHLRITHRSGQWQCAEIVSARTFGFGSYRFALASRVDNLDPSAVLGLFTWSDDPAYTHREIDVECSRWSNAADPNNAQFVVQPWSPPGQLVRFAVPAGLTNATPSFLWQSNQIVFQCQRGAYSPAPGTNLIRSWTYARAVPQTGDENVRLNLWLNNGAAPTDGNEVEVVIGSFEFVPPGPPAPARLRGAAWSPGAGVRVVLDGEQDRRYVVEAAEGFPVWHPLATVLATSASFEFLDTNVPFGPQRFYRSVTLP